MSVKELVDTAISDGSVARIQERKDLEAFLDEGHDPSSSKFMKMLEKGQMKYGPYALTLAKHFAKKI